MDLTQAGLNDAHSNILTLLFRIVTLSRCCMRWIVEEWAQNFHMEWNMHGMECSLTPEIRVYLFCSKPDEILFLSPLPKRNCTCQSKVFFFYPVLHNSTCAYLGREQRPQNCLFWPLHEHTQTFRQCFRQSSQPFTCGENTALFKTMRSLTSFTVHYRAVNCHQ